MKERDDHSRTWTEADQAAGLVPICVLRVHGSHVLWQVERDRRELVVLRYGRPIARLVPLTPSAPK